jgi:hypothetical protein
VAKNKEPKFFRRRRRARAGDGEMMAVFSAFFARFSPLVFYLRRP